MKILYLVNKKYYQTKMARERFHGILALEKLPPVSVIWWGIGWSGYDNNLSVSQNIKNNNLEYDFIIVYKPLEMKYFKSVPGKKILRYNEMYDFKWTCQEIDESGCQYIICHHLNDYHKYQKIYAQKNPLIHFYHIAHCAEKTIFYSHNLPFKYRKYDVVVSGAISDVYPMRIKFKNILNKLQAEKKYHVYFHNHPGYDITDAYTNKCQKQLAEIYRNAKICLTCSSKFKYRLGKYVEIPACGSVICGDLPDEEQEEFNKFMIVISPQETENEIISKIDKILNNPLEWQELSEKGNLWAKNYTQEKYASRMFLILSNILESN